MKYALITLVVVCALVIAGTLLAISQFKLSALPEPGHMETYLVTRAKHALVRRNSREAIPPAPSNLKASIEAGDKLFGTECAACHGLDGHTPTDAGRWMYPRRRPHVARRATLLGSRIILDCEEWNSFKRHARLSQSGDRRAHLEPGPIRPDVARFNESSLKSRIYSRIVVT